MALGHEKLDVYRLAIHYRMAAMLSRLGRRGYKVREDSGTYGIDPDSDSGPDPDFEIDSECPSQGGMLKGEETP